MCVCAQECVYVYVMYVWVLTEGKKKMSYALQMKWQAIETQYWCCELNSDRLKEQQMILTIGQSLPLIWVNFKWNQ